MKNIYKYAMVACIISQPILGMKPHKALDAEMGRLEGRAFKIACMLRDSRPYASEDNLNTEFKRIRSVVGDEDSPENPYQRKTYLGSSFDAKDSYTIMRFFEEKTEANLRLLKEQLESLKTTGAHTPEDMSPHKDITPSDMKRSIKEQKLLKMDLTNRIFMCSK